MTDQMIPLTDEQIDNWRKFLCTTPIGPYALIAPKEIIQKLRDKYQEQIDTKDTP